MKYMLAILGLIVAVWIQAAAAKDEATRVTITRDDWGIAHIHGKSDADAVFGMIYAQAEDDFSRVEMHYLIALGRTAEADGESAIWADLRQRLFIDPADLKAKYAASPAYLKALMVAWADGLNYYLSTHPQTHPKVITHFEPWMALSFSEGSVGGDISQVSLSDLEAFYSGRQPALEKRADLRFEEPKGSNGIAIAPKMTRDGHAMLLINPHTSFYFRSEAQVTSDEGLNVYGASTWGQFFVYQGFNDHVGWMHTTSSADCVDEFAETIVTQNGRQFYRHGTALRPVQSSNITLRYRAADGRMATRTFTVFRTHHGPIVRAADGKWIATALMNRPVEALEQSFGRTKTHDLASYLKVAALAANSSNDTLFADDKGEIAFLTPQFTPQRDNRFDYTKPVDGSNPDADWRGITPLKELPQVLNPPNGWVYNTNDGPWWSAGGNSPRRDDFPRYMDLHGANARTAHALELLQDRGNFTLQSFMETAFDSHLTTFTKLIPGLLAAYDALPDSDPSKAKLAAQIAVLRGWDCRWSAKSVATTLAVKWAETLWKNAVPNASGRSLAVEDGLLHATPEQKITAFADAVDQLARDFGDWRTPWGDVNRFQRLDDAIAPHFDDAAPSVPIPFTSAQWGSLASYGAKRFPNTKKIYGLNGNSFVAVVEFGPRIQARAVNVGGQSGDPASKHFQDGIERYASGNLRPVYFYPDELAGHIERTYRPGQ